MLAFRCQCGLLQGWFDHPDVTRVVEFDNQWRSRKHNCRIMVPATPEQIDVEAYYLWCAAGRPVSDGKEFWHAAAEKLKAGVEKFEVRDIAYSSATTWKCPCCGVEHKHGHNAYEDKNYKPLYKTEWSSPCSCGAPLDDVQFSSCLKCRKKNEKKEKKK